MVIQTIPHSFSVFFTAGARTISSESGRTSAQERCRYLEQGGIIFFPESPFGLSQDEQKFLLSQKQLEAANHKNIAYKPAQGQITGAGTIDPVAQERLRSVLSDFTARVQSFLRDFLSPYARGWQLDFASFRPVEEQGRKMRLRARNDLLHVDSFPTRPVFGNRIFRVFHNLNPHTSRIWHTSDPFEKLAPRFKEQLIPRHNFLSAFVNKLPGFKAIASRAGITMSDSSPYDRWMMNFHNFLKENTGFQRDARKDRWEFPPNSAWMVFTDCVSHAAMSGQYALEQTFIISKQDMAAPELAPVNVLERMYPGGGFANVGSPA